MDASTPLRNTVSGGIVLVERCRTCDIALQARHAQQAGAEGVLIINGEDQGALCIAPVGDCPSDVTIPILMIGREAGNRIFNKVRRGRNAGGITFQSLSESGTM